MFVWVGLMFLVFDSFIASMGLTSIYIIFWGAVGIIWMIAGVAAVLMSSRKRKSEDDSD
jgi:glycogen synthase